MNKTLKKTLSIMLSILMIVTTMPMAFAADGHTHALSADGETVEFTELPADATRIDTAGNYYLTQDIELTNNLWIEVEGTVNLCLNGHSITAVEDSSNKTVVFLYGGTLNLCDCKGGGCITSAEDLTFSGVRALGDTEFNMYSGEIKNNYYYAVQGGNFNMYGGKLSGNKKTAVYVTDSFNMYGGEISGNSKSAIEGVAVEVYAGNFNMYGGEIKNNENISSYINASIVGVNGGATFTMYDGKICDNEGPAVYSGGTFIMNGGEISGNSGYSSGVSVGTGGIFTMNGGAIKNNTASGRGGGVYINERASFNMNGGEISSNTAEQGGGVFSTYDSAKINLKKGVITGNSATYAGGVGAQYANTPVEISGADVQIINNTATTYPDLRVNAPVTVSAPLDSAKTKISLSVNGYIIAKPDGTNLTTLKGMEDCFIQPYENLLVVCNSDGELEAIEWSASIAEKDGDLVVNAPNNDSVTYQWYEVNGEELTELEGETSDKLTADKIVLGKTYACQVYLEGEEMELLKIKCSYAITHQPTLEEPYVELNDDTDASYQWFEVEGKSIEITDENVRPFDPAETGIPAEFFSGTVTYDAEAGWSPMMLSDAGWLLYFVADLKAGEVVSVEFSSEFPMVVSLSGLTMDEEVYLTVDGNRAGGVVEKDGEYALKVECDIFDLTSLPLAKAYFDSEVYNSIEGATEAELADPVFGNTYACEVTFADGTTEMSDVLDLSYKITHQPTAAEPYVELNNYTDVTYQWYTVECNYAEITDENADTVAYDWGESSYSEETGWTGVPYEEDYYGQDFFTVELEAGETITVEVTGDFTDGIGLYDYDTENEAWVDSEEDVTSYELTVESEGNYTFYTYVNSGVVTVKAYKTAVEKTAIEGETSAELKNPEIGKKYACEVTFVDDTTETSDEFEYKYAITHQPTEAEPYVETNDSRAAYQWYAAEDSRTEVVEDGVIGDCYEDSYYDEETGWNGQWWGDDGADYLYVYLEEGQTVTIVPSAYCGELGIWSYNNYDYYDYDECNAGEEFKYTADIEDWYGVYAYTDYADETTLRAYIGNITYSEIEGQTSAILTPTALGKYACEVTFVDGTTEMSDTFEVTKLHDCDFSGEWKYDAEKHWKECTVDGCGKVSEEAEHSGGTATCTEQAKCQHCGASYGEVDKNNHDETVAYVNGFCPNCDAFEPAKLVNGVYEISNAGNLYWFADKVTNENAAYGSADAILTADITVNENVLAADGTANAGTFWVWTPIGKRGFGVNIPYTGTFEGNGKTVSGLYFNDTSANFSVGLFSLVGEGGKVQNVGIADSYLCGSQSIGAVAGSNYGTVTGCYNTGTVSGTSSVGGVVGSNDGTVTDCHNSGTVSGESSVGGVAGDCIGEASLVGCYNTGTVSGTTNIGGVVGFTNATVTNCYFDSTVYTGDAIGNNYGTATDVEGKSTEQFAGGEVAYLLSQGESGSIWGQDLDNGKPVQTTPTFNGAKVYCGYTSCGDTVAKYTNDETISAEKPDHTQKPTYTDNGDGTHSAVYPCCGTTVTEEHDFENDAHQCVCGKMETFTVSWVLSGSLMQSTSTYGQEFTQTFTVPENTHLRIDSVYLANDASVPVNYTYENGVLTIAATDVPAADVYIDCDHNVLVTFHANGGEIIPEDGFPQEGSNDIFPEDGSYWTREWNYGSEICLIHCAAVCREGYTFVDWRDASGQVHQVIPGNGNYTLATEDMTFYAQWQCNHTIGGVVFRDNGNGTHNGYCGECDELLGNYVEHPHNFGDNTHKCVCGYACPHDSYTDGVCDNCDYECPHEWGEGVLTRPTFETDGYYTYTCTLCGHSYTEPAKEADTTALNDAYLKVTEYIDNDTLTQEAKDEIYKSYRDILRNNGNIFDEFGFVRGDLIEEDQPAIDAVTEALEKIIADADEKIASGEYVKADYTKIDEAIDDIEEKLASENVTDEGKAELEEIKKQLEEMKADENTSAADVAELEKALEDYEEELDKGIEDGTLVEVDVDAIADDVNKKWAEKLEAEGLLDEYEDFINNQKATDEAMATVDEINDFANSLEGTVAENAENIAKLNEMLDSLYSSFENCLRGTHNFKDYETTSPAKCGENAVETSTCWFCGETDEREVEGTALEHSFTKYEETEAPKCGVAGKEVAYCDNGCQTTDERETPALEHIFLDYVSNGDATCTADGTKTASCLNGCGTTDTVADEGSMIDHSDEDGDKLCDDCGEEVYDRCDICGGKAHGDDKIQLVFCMIITIIRIVTAILKSIY